MPIGAIKLFPSREHLGEEILFTRFSYGGDAMVRTIETDRNFPTMHFANAQLGDVRRTRRLVTTAELIRRHPGGSFPDKFHSPKDLDAFYDLCNRPEVTHESVLAPHRELTLSRIAEAEQTVLIVHDSTELDYTGRKSLEGQLGQIGNGNRRGYICHNSLAVNPVGRAAVGLVSQVLHRRENTPKDETAAQSRERESRESRIWIQGTSALPADWRLVDVCDRGADTFEFLAHECNSGRRFVIRSCYNRVMFEGDEDGGARRYLHSFARTLKPFCRKTKKVNVAARDGQSARTAHVMIAGAPVRLNVPLQARGHYPHCRLLVWIVRVWEPDPPDGAEPLEWFLLTNEPVGTHKDALRVVGWYECRWIIEELHKAMKTGCDIENPQFTKVERLQPAIALLSIVALTLLNLRDASRMADAKTRSACELFSCDYIEVLSGWRYGEVRSNLTVHDFFYALGAASN
ncbi:MAG: IS4 family transposase [Pirellulaceae bacterium]